MTSANGSSPLPSWSLVGAPPGVVEEPDPITEQHRRDVQVELVDESALEGVPEGEVVHSALRRAVRVYGLSRYRVDAPRAGEADVPPALVLGFGNVNEERIRRGVEVLGEVLSGAHA